MCDRFLITSVFPIRFVSLVSFVSVASFVSLCHLVHKTGRFSGEHFPFTNWSLEYAPGVYSFFIPTPGHGAVKATGWQYTKCLTQEIIQGYNRLRQVRFLMLCKGIQTVLDSKPV